MKRLRATLRWLVLRRRLKPALKQPADEPMSPISRAILASWSINPKIALGLAVTLAVYFRGWRILHRTLPQRFPVWRALAFASGLICLWLAMASPLDALSGFLLSAHMVQHLLLMSVVPPLMLLGSPLLPLLRGLPGKLARDGVGPFLVWPPLRRAGQLLTHPVSCWAIMAITLFAWHVPTAFDLALHSPAWHKVEHACFLAASLLFWWPVIRPFPSRPHWPLWSVPLYLLAADLLNTALSAILTFADHPLYSEYLNAPRLFGTTALADQNCAGLIMWVPGSLAFLIPAVLIAMRFLSPADRLVRLEVATQFNHGQTRPHESTEFFSILTIGLRRAMRKATAIVDERFKSPKIRAHPHSSVVSNSVVKGQTRRRFDLLSVPLIGKFLKANATRRLFQATLLIIAIAVVADGIFGPQVSAANLAGVLPWTYWRVFVVIALLVAGNLFCMACPFMLFRELGRRLGLRKRPWPRALRSKWMGIVLLLLFFWAYEVFGLWDKPIWTAWLLLNYFLLAFTIDAFFNKASFCKYLCPIGQFQFVASLMSPLEVKVRNPDVCASCKTHDCLRGNSNQRGCEMDLYLPRKSGNLDCTFCLDCARACPHDNIGVIAVAPGMDVVQDKPRSSLGRLSRRTDIAVLALVFVFAAFANPALMVAPISNWRNHVTTRLNLASILPVTSALLAVALIVAPIILIGGSMFAGKKAAGIKVSTRELINRFSLALVPLAVSMWAAHFLFHFLVGWNSAWPIVQRAVGDLGLTITNYQAVHGSRQLISMSELRSLQIVLLDLGLLATLYLGWRTARIYAPRLHLAFRVMAPWSVAAIGLYLLGVWICLQPMQMRGLATA